jgi:hypothetical protein
MLWGKWPMKLLSPNWNYCHWVHLRKELRYGDLLNFQ